MWRSPPRSVTSPSNQTSNCPWVARIRLGPGPRSLRVPGPMLGIRRPRWPHVLGRLPWLAFFLRLALRRRPFLPMGEPSDRRFVMMLLASRPADHRMPGQNGRSGGGRSLASVTLCGTRSGFGKSHVRFVPIFIYAPSRARQLHSSLQGNDTINARFHPVCPVASGASGNSNPQRWVNDSGRTVGFATEDHRAE